MSQVIQNDARVYVLGGLLGLCAGLLDVRVGDLLVTALLVLASTMWLGALRPRRPWRWALVVAVFVPIMHLLAHVLTAQKPYPAQIYESFLEFLPGLVGAYGGALGRNTVSNILGQK
jgi:hypothetical protein